MNSNPHNFGPGSAEDLTYSFSFFEKVSSQHGHDTAKKLRDYLLISTELSQLYSSRKFLLKWRSPRSFTKNIVNATRSLDSIYYHNEMYRQLLALRKLTSHNYIFKLEIKDVNYKINNVEKLIDQLNSIIRNSNLDAHTMYNFLNLVSEVW